jgi:hypothetical protein
MMKEQKMNKSEILQTARRYLGGFGKFQDLSPFRPLISVLTPDLIIDGVNYSYQRNMARMLLNYSDEFIPILPREEFSLKLKEKYGINFNTMLSVFGDHFIHIAAIEGSMDFMQACGNLIKLTGDKQLIFSCPSKLIEESLDLWMKVDKDSFDKACDYFGFHPSNRHKFALVERIERQAAINFWIAISILDGADPLHNTTIPNIYKIDEFSGLFMNKSIFTFSFGTFSDEEITSTRDSLECSVENSERKFYRWTTLHTKTNPLYET